MTERFVFGGLRIILGPNMSDHAGWDFSRCRSPARAMRRAKRFGHSKWVREIRTPKRQVIRIFETLIMHPAIWAQVKASLPQPEQLRGLS